jgi:Chitin binding Peritrophin-A domain
MSTFIAAYLKFSSPVPKYRVDAGEYLYYKHENDVALYYMCVDGKPRLNDCGQNNYWDETNKSCVPLSKLRKA